MNHRRDAVAARFLVPGIGRHITYDPMLARAERLFRWSHIEIDDLDIGISKKSSSKHRADIRAPRKMRQRGPFWASESTG